MLAGEVFNTYSPHSDLDCDVTDSDCLAENGSTVKHQFLTDRNINRVKNCGASVR